MTEVPRTQAQRREDTRNRLLEAGAQVFARIGAHASVAEIAAEAGCSTGAIYTHFSGKRDLLLAVFDHKFANWDLDYFAAVAGSTTAVQAGDAAAHQWTQDVREQPLLTQLYVEFWMASRRDPDLAIAFRERQARIISATSTLIAEQLDTLGIATDIEPTTLGAIATALSDGLALQHLAGTTPDAGDMLALATELVVRGLATDPPR